MTLQEWSQKTGILPTTTETGAVSLCASSRTPYIDELWRLDDYYVSTAGSVIWLMPKTEKRKKYEARLDDNCNFSPGA